MGHLCHFDSLLLVRLGVFHDGRSTFLPRCMGDRIFCFALLRNLLLLSYRVLVVVTLFVDLDLSKH